MPRGSGAWLASASLALASPASPAWGAGGEPPAARTASVSADQLLAFADRARDAGDLATAETAYRALFADPSVEVRSEARFRLAMMLSGLRRWSDSAVLLREVLDEQPGAQRVRLELARVLDAIGDEAGARRALREAQAGRLPDEVARFVDRYSAALRAQKPLGGSVDVALAPDSNINRATSSSTLGTVLGDFVLDQDAQQQSGLGVALRGQAFARLRLGAAASLLGRVSGSADLYGVAAFNDIAVAVTLGPELHSGADRISLDSGVLLRLYGGRAYSRAATAGVGYLHPLGRTAQLRIAVNLALIDNRLNPLQDGRSYSASLSYERALSNRAGVGVTLSLDRQALRDPGYSTRAGQVTLFGYRELGPVTLVATLGYGGLEADERLAFFPEARSERVHRVSLGATLRSFRVGTFAPFVRATYERNQSSIAIYDNRRLRSEVGISRSF